jgi:AcrR family transcriptional regulator
VAQAAVAGSTRERETRLRILDAAVECFARYGNDKTTVDDVARVAGLTRQTIYRYFPGRAALLEAVDRLEDDRLQDDATAIAARAGSLEEFVAGIVERQVAVAHRYRTRQHLLDLDRGLSQSMFVVQRRRTARLRELLVPQVAEARRRGELQPWVDAAEASEWLALCVAGVTGLTAAETFDLDDPASVGRFYASHLCRGLVRPGRLSRP